MHFVNLRLPALLVMASALFLFAPPLLAQDIVFKSTTATAYLVELYSSEGCSSCPPAEAWTSHLKTAPGLWKEIFPVAFHVDYWDDLGWPDRFARPEYTQRQRDYAARLNQDSVYTPEFVVNGHEWRRSWFSAETFPALGAEKTGRLSLTVHDKDKTLSALYVPGPPATAQPLMLNVALLGFNVVSDVKRGENGGRKLQHDFVVIGFTSTPLTAATDQNLRSDPVPLKSSTGDAIGGVVAWVSNPDGAVLQIAGGELPAATHPL